MRRFILNRIKDETGISGVGHIADGVKFQNGPCVLRWRTDPGSIGIYENMVGLMKIHGHEGKTVVEWIDLEFKRASLASGNL